MLFLTCTDTPQTVLASMPDATLGAKPHAALVQDSSVASITTAPHGVATALQPHMQFEPNLGQIDPEVKFMARGVGYTVFLTPDEAVLVFPVGEPQPETNTTGGNAPVPSNQVVQLQVLNANPTTVIHGVGETPSTINRLIGADPTQWQTKIPVYDQVRYDAIYPGIDLLYYGNQQQLEYDFIVHPGADPSRITLGIQGIDHATLEADGHLLLTLPGGTLRLQKPELSQTVAGEQTAVPGSFRILEPNPTDTTAPPIQIAFTVGAYDPTLPLIIDPLVNYASAFGGEGEDKGEAIALDNVGHGYVVGTTESFTFPVTADAFQNSAIGSDRDIFVTKFDTETSEILFSTYIGGEGDDRATGVAVDAEGIPYVTGQTTSLTFPTQHPIQETLKGPSDAFVLKLAADGSSLLYSTYLGGSGPDHANGIVIDAQGQAALTGTTTSPDFPTNNAIDTVLGHGKPVPQSDVFVSTLDAQGAALQFSTFLGGAGADVGHSLVLDAQGALYLTGETTDGAGFPVTTRSFQPTYGGGASDAFIVKINPALPGATALQYASYLGGSGQDVGLDLLVDAQQQTFITGWTTGQGQASAVAASSPARTPNAPVRAWGRRSGPPAAVNPARGFRGVMRGFIQQQQAPTSPPAPVIQVTTPTPLPGFPVTPNAYDATFNGEKDAFIAQVNLLASGPTALAYATYVGGNQADTGTAIGVDSLGRVCIAGTTASTNYPVKNALADHGTLHGGTDGFVTKLQADPTTLLFSSFLGGSGNETVTDMRLDDGNNAYLTGQTRSTDFPLLTSFDDTPLTGEPQAFVVKVQDPVTLRLNLIGPLSSPARVGEISTFGLEWTNLGPDDATGVQLELDFTGVPQIIVRYVSITNTGGASDIDINSCSGSALSGPGGTLTCGVSNIPASLSSSPDFSTANIMVEALLAGTFTTEDDATITAKELDATIGGPSVAMATLGDLTILPPLVDLTVDFQGSGTGSVVARPGPSSPLATIMDDATLPYDSGTRVSLIPTPTGPLNNPSVFNGWTGCDSVNQAGTCTVTVTADQTVVPVFDLANEAPTVNAGPNQTITLPGDATLNGTVTDDDLPAPPTLTTTWSEVSGPGTVTFADAAAVDTTATFSAPGTYVLRLTANDGALSDSDSITVAVIPAQRTLTVTTTGSGSGTVTGPGVNCGPDCTETVSDGTQITLTAAPNPSFFFTGWAVSGSPTATCTGTGTCTIILDTNRTVTATFAANQPPVVEAGQPQVINLPAGATLPVNVSLNGTITDDGLPRPASLTSLWRLVTGPAVIPDILNNAVPTVRFPAIGAYILELSANDSVLSGVDTVTITINDPSAAQVLIPSVVGQPEAVAITALTTVSLTRGTITQELNALVPSGSVIRQTPFGGDFANPGTPVNLVISSGTELLITMSVDGPDATPGNGICETSPGNGACSLRAAIQEANAFPGQQTITLTPDTYLLTMAGANEDTAATGDLDITDDLIIESSTGNATEVIITGNALDRVFDLPPGSSPSVTLRGLTIQDGLIAGSTGGGLRNAQGTLTVEDCMVMANQSNGSGGGISHLGGSLNLRDTTVADNMSQGLGGGLQAQGGTALIDGNTQFRGNTANFGGGLSVGRANVTVTNTLVENNTAIGVGGGIYKFLSPSDLLGGSPSFEVQLSNSTIRNNRPNNCEGNLSGC